MKKPLLAFLFVILGGWFVFPGSGPAAGVDWKLCSENEFLSLYFDSARLNREGDELVQVWVKYVPKGKKGREFWAHVRNLEKIPLKQFQHYAYSLVLYELSCHDQVYRLISGIDYDRGKRMLAEMPLSNWKPVFPDSLIETLHQAVCH